jgi:hypothetical protein
MNVLARERGVTAHYLMRLAKNWGLPIRHHSEYSGIGHLDLPAPPSPAMRAVTMRTGALNRLALITQIPGHASLQQPARSTAGATPSCGNRSARSKKPPGFTIIERTTTPLTPTQRGREFLHEARQILHAAREGDVTRPRRTTAARCRFRSEIAKIYDHEAHELRSWACQPAMIAAVVGQ